MVYLFMLPTTSYYNNVLENSYNKLLTCVQMESPKICIFGGLNHNMNVRDRNVHALCVWLCSDLMSIGRPLLCIYTCFIAATRWLCWNDVYSVYNLIQYRRLAAILVFMLF